MIKNKIEKEIRKAFDLFLTEQRDELRVNIWRLISPDHQVVAFAIIDFCFEKQ